MASASAAAAMWALLPAGLSGSELVLSAVVSRCFVNRASDIADRASSALWRMSGLGLGSCAAPEPAFARTFVSSSATGLVIDVDKFDLPDGYRTVTDTLLRPKTTTSTAEVIAPTTTHTMSPPPPPPPPLDVARTNEDTCESTDELAHLRHIDAFARVQFVQAVLQDALHAFRPNNQHYQQAGESNDSATTGTCTCGSLLCTSRTLQEALGQIESDLLQILLHLARITDRRTRHRQRLFAAWRSSSHQINIDAITRLLPRLEAKIERLFHATPWIKLVHNTLSSST